MESNITCPSCGASIDVEDVLERRTRERVESEMSAKLADAVQRAQEEGARKARESTEAEVRALREEKAERDKALAEARTKEVELIRLKDEMRRKDEERELELEKRLYVERERVEKAARMAAEERFALESRKNAERLDEQRRQEAERYEMALREKDKQLEDARRTAEDMKRRMEQGSQQLQGEVQELAIEEFLRQTFPYDIIDEVGKGQRGADCLLRVHDKGRVLGTIQIESKRTKSFDNKWIEKFKEDMRSSGAEVGLLVSEVLPKDMERFGQRQGIWICRFDEFKALIHVLRVLVIRVGETASSQENTIDKKALLYSYLTGSEFRMEIEAIVEGFQAMQVDLQKERTAMERIWKAREKQLERVVTASTRMWGSIEGIAGGTLGPLRPLELPGSENDTRS